MTEDEYATLLQLLRRRTRDGGRADLDASLVESRLRGSGSNREAVLRYLAGLRTDFASRSVSTLTEVSRRFAQFGTENGSAVDGFVIAVSDGDRAIFPGREFIDPFEFAEPDVAVEEIDSLIVEIVEDEDVR